ncbi:MAG TPA: aspartate kinase [Anaerolineae bacterium]|nr:aspartate kinase [Anaerolineae bacterium]MCB9106815.1 aspartate kinase [Anaerolineales bacterium]HRV91479.1 aspartate kinase [Anaerolineae bacterium]
MLIVMKFGGTSVGSVDALKNVVKIVSDARQNGHEIVVVVSAMSGVTNLLLNAAAQAEVGHEEIAHQAKTEIAHKHAEATLHFLDHTPERDAVLAEINTLLDEFEALCHGICVLGELTPRALDVIGGLGERMNAPQVAAILNRAGLPAASIEATQLIVTDNCFGSAIPLIDETEANTQARLRPLLDAGKIPVVTGFIGSTEDGIPTTLGRGGSDYSATILGRALGADEVWIWTDVNGVMTADPRVVPEAHPISHLSYAEISELSYFGAKVLHSQAIRPARRVNMPVRILNTFAPDHPGTLITADYKNNGKTVKAVTAIKNMSLVTVSGPGMIGITGVAGRTFTAVARTSTNVLMISQASSEQSICFVIPTSDVPKVVASLEAELIREIERRDLEQIKWEEDTVILAVVGAGMKGQPGVSGRLFGALGQEKINIIAIAQGSSEFNISLVVAQGEADLAVKAIHREFKLEKP